MRATGSSSPPSSKRPTRPSFKRSLARLATPKVDLLQLHNVRDPRQSLAQFRDWKAQGICRYIGITSTYHGDFAAVEAVLEREKPDFVQIDYSLDDRERRRAHPAARGRGQGRRADRAAVRPRPAVPRGARQAGARLGAAISPDSWAQFFLKFLLADARITAVIPGTSNPAHMADNLGAMRGRLPDAAERKRMIEWLGTR